MPVAIKNIVLSFVSGKASGMTTVVKTQINADPRNSARGVGIPIMTVSRIYRYFYDVVLDMRLSEGRCM